MAALGKLLVVVLSVALPFFLTYSTPSTYLLSRFLPILTSSHCTIAPHYAHTQVSHRNHHFLIHLHLHQSLYILFLSSHLHLGTPLSIQQSSHGGVLTFRFRWAHADIVERVTKVQVTLFFSYSASGSTQLGMASGSLRGYSIAEGSIAGVLNIERGSGQGVISDSSTSSTT